jgi:hypothetical protein
MRLAKSFDLATSVNRDVVEKWQYAGANARYWQIGYEPDGVIERSNISHDVVFLASGYSEKRQSLVRRIRGFANINFGLYGNGWVEGWSKGQNLYNFREAANIYLGAKIAIGDSQWPNSGFVSNRIMQILAAGGCILCHQWFRDFEKLGLQNGLNCVIWQDVRELEQKMRYYLSHENERVEMSRRGQELAFARHSFDTRVRELFAMLEPEKELETNWRW